MRCKTCHYSLKNLTEHRCPECGNPFDPNDPSTFDPEPLSTPETVSFWLIAAGVPTAVWAIGWDYGDRHPIIALVGRTFGVLLGLFTVWFGWKVYRARR